MKYKRYYETYVCYCVLRWTMMYRACIPWGLSRGEERLSLSISTSPCMISYTTDKINQLENKKEQDQKIVNGVNVTKLFGTMGATMDNPSFGVVVK
jgi:hypothetical protein